MVREAGVGQKPNDEEHSQEEENETPLQTGQLLPLPPARLPAVFAIIVGAAVWVRQGQRDEVLPGWRVHPLV